MKHILVWSFAVVLLGVGCRSASSLDRGTPPPKSSKRSKAQSKPLIRKSESVDPAFDLVFRRKQSDDHGASILSGDENRRFKDGDAADAAALRTIRGERLRKNKANKDWVYGTKDGKYF